MQSKLLLSNNWPCTRLGLVKYQFLQQIHNMLVIYEAQMEQSIKQQELSRKLSKMCGGPTKVLPPCQMIFLGFLRP